MKQSRHIEKIICSQSIAQPARQSQAHTHTHTHEHTQKKKSAASSYLEFFHQHLGQLAALALHLVVRLLAKPLRPLLFRLVLNHLLGCKRHTSGNTEERERGGVSLWVILRWMWGPGAQRNRTTTKRSTKWHPEIAAAVTTQHHERAPRLPFFRRFDDGRSETDAFLPRRCAASGDRIEYKFRRQQRDHARTHARTHTQASKHIV